jgi:hypothetical protein
MQKLTKKNILELAFHQDFHPEFLLSVTHTMGLPSDSNTSVKFQKNLGYLL